MAQEKIKIDKEKCMGCQLCLSACQQGVIAMVDGKAAVVREDYCDGLKACLPSCQTGAITFVTKDEITIAADQAATETEVDTLPGGCPGTKLQEFDRTLLAETNPESTVGSQLRQWPIQIKLVPNKAPYLDNADILIAADCTAYACGNFHNEYLKNRICLIACPKLDAGDYSEKLQAIISNNSIKSLTVVRMEVPCCGGLENALRRALSKSGKKLPIQVVTLAINGEIVEM